MKIYSYCFLFLVLIGAATAAPLKVQAVMAPVPLKQSSTDPSRFVAIIPFNATRIVLKFDSPISAEISKTSEFEVAFEEEQMQGESPIVKLNPKAGGLEKPVIVEVTDKKSGDSAKVMIKMEEAEPKGGAQ
ncbi:unnamed protein product [Caenorhabditis brenneri]